MQLHDFVGLAAARRQGFGILAAKAPAPTDGRAGKYVPEHCREGRD